MWGRTSVLLAMALVSAVAYGDDQYRAPDASSATSTAASDTTDIESQKRKCQEEWRKYRDSQACFARYRLVDGGLKVEAYKHCAEIKQPELCE